MTRLHDHLVLVGFMGSGKSSVGRLLADALGVCLVDIDKRVVASAGRSIPELFAEEGEAGFRDREAAELARVAAEPPSVVATGGGVILRDANREILRRLGPVVYLEVTPAEALRRCAGSDDRPLLAGGGAGEAADLLAARVPLYEEVSTVALPTDGRAPAEIAEAILGTLSLTPMPDLERRKEAE